MSDPPENPYRTPLTELEDAAFALGDDEPNPDPLAGTAERARLFHKLLLAQDAAPNPEPDGVFTGGPLQGKPYVSAAGAVRSLAPTLREFGLILTVSEIETSTERFEGRPKTDRSGTITAPGVPWWMYRGIYEFQLTDCQTGYTATFRQGGASANDDDRGPQHAHAQATKVFLMSLLQVQMDVGEGQRKPKANKPAGNASGRPQELRGGQAPPQQQPTGSPPPQQSAAAKLGASARIPEAQGKRFVKRGTTWILESTGEELRGCDCGGPMLELKAGEFHCVDKAHGEIWRAPQVPPPESDPLMDDLKQAARVTRTLTEAKDAFARVIEKNRLFPWQLRAIIESNNYVLDQSKWGASIYLEIVEAMQKNPQLVVASALAEMAKRTPVDKETVGHLENLITRAKVVGIASIEVGEAIKSGWHDAVVELIERYEQKVGQGELPVGGHRTQPGRRNSPGERQ